MAWCATFDFKDHPMLSFVKAKMALETTFRGIGIIDNARPMFTGTEEQAAALWTAENKITMEFATKDAVDAAIDVLESDMIIHSSMPEQFGQMVYDGYNYMAFSGGEIGEDEEEPIATIEWLISPTEFIRNLREVADKLEAYHKAHPEQSITAEID